MGSLDRQQSSATDVQAEAWDSRVGHLLWEAGALIKMRRDARLADSPLTAAGLSVADLVAAEPGISVAQIARRSYKTQQSISHTVARLEAAGYVERRVRSGRGIGLHLSDMGAQAHDEARQREAELDDLLLMKLGDASLETLRQLLLQTRDALITEKADSAS